MRILAALVIFMGVLIVAGIVVVAVTIYDRLERASGEATPARSPFATEVTVPAGCEVVEAVPDGVNLVLRLGAGAQCNEVLVVDMRTGAVLGRVTVVPAR